MEFVEVDVAQGATEVNISFPRGSDAITEYDIFCFLVTPDRKLYQSKLYLVPFVVEASSSSFAEIAIEATTVRVKNKYFTQTVNPSEMVLGDQCTLRTVVQNTDTVNAMRNIVLHMQLQGLELKQEDTVRYARELLVVS